MILLGVKWKPLWRIEPGLQIAALRPEISERGLTGLSLQPWTFVR